MPVVAAFASSSPLLQPTRCTLRRRYRHLTTCSLDAPPSPRQVVVVGAGIIGLTTAIRLREAGHHVTILAQETPSTILNRHKTLNADTSPSTYTSVGAGGLWMPVLLADPRAEHWAARTLSVLRQHADHAPGVALHDGFLVSRTMRPLPWYASLVSMTRETPESDQRVPTRYPHACRFVTPIVRMDDYLPYLERVLGELSVPLVLTRSHTPPTQSTRWALPRVRDFARSISPDALLVICAGIGSAPLTDDTIVPVRGVTVRVKRPAYLDYHISEDHEDGFHSEGLLAYAIPRGPEMTLGGTAFFGDWNEDATDDEIDAVKHRAEQLLGVSDLEEVARWTGLRPLRQDSAVRFGFVDNGVIANYGHGGSGVTNCWGCADQVVDLVNQS